MSEVFSHSIPAEQHQLSLWGLIRISSLPWLARRGFFTFETSGFGEQIKTPGYAMQDTHIVLLNGKHQWGILCPGLLFFSPFHTRRNIFSDAKQVSNIFYHRCSPVSICRVFFSQLNQTTCSISVKDWWRVLKKLMVHLHLHSASYRSEIIINSWTFKRHRHMCCLSFIWLSLIAWGHALGVPVRT